MTRTPTYNQLPAVTILVTLSIKFLSLPNNKERIQSLVGFLDKPEYKPRKFALVKATCATNG